MDDIRRSSASRCRMRRQLTSVEPTLAERAAWEIEVLGLAVSVHPLQLWSSNGPKARIFARMSSAAARSSSSSIGW